MNIKARNIIEFSNDAYYYKWKYIQIEKLKKIKARIYYKWQWKKEVYNLKNYTYYEKNLIWDFLNGYCEVDRMEGYISRKYY